MISLLETNLAELAGICRERHVRRLAIFGSAARGEFKPGTSDLDFLVEFDPLPPAEHARHYFGLMADLERLYGVPVDLVEREPIRNPYFREALEESQVELYASA